MLISAILSLALSLSVGDASATITPCTAGLADTGATAIVALRIDRLPADTPHARPKIIDVSDWYARRFAIHRALSYAILPLFAIQWDAGLRLYKHPIDSPSWVLPTHRATAAAIGTVFLVNTVTGVWNLWDSRDVADHRAVRTIHAISMLTADAGFTYAGAFLSRPARNNLAKRRLHREIAISSMTLAMVSGVAMKLLNR